MAYDIEYEGIVYFLHKKRMEPLEVTKTRQGGGSLHVLWRAPTTDYRHVLTWEGYYPCDYNFMHDLRMHQTFGDPYVWYPCTRVISIAYLTGEYVPSTDICFRNFD